MTYDHNDVFIVLIETKGLHSSTRVGAVYRNYTEAAKEVERLKAANTFTYAWWVARQVEEERK